MKQEAIKQEVERLLANKIIRTTSATSVSQLLLVLKPDGRFRPCVDFRILNECTSDDDMGWPIPNIEQMLDRLGQQGAKFFGILDLTAGYHQTILHEDVVKLTAFATYAGVYEWLRVPMGLKGAPSYFQYIMSTIVLAGLVERVCEVYLDDIIIHGRTEEEYLVNLETVLIALEKRRITLNPKKIKSGMLNVEFVGRTIDKDGITYSMGKRDSVLNFPQPVFAGELKMFIGLTGYFRDSVAELSMMQALATHQGTLRQVQTKAEITVG